MSTAPQIESYAARFLPSQERSGSYLRALLLAAAAVMLGQALLIAGGTYHPVAMLWLTGCVLASIAALFAPSLPALEASGEIWLERVLALGVTIQAASIPVIEYPRTAIAGHFVDSRYIILPAVFVVLTQIRRVPPAWWLLPVLAAHFAFGFWLLRNMPVPPNDVLLFQQDAAKALLHGVNPYAITFPDPYPPDAGVYGPGVSVAGRLLFGFPYPPLSLLLVLPGYLLAGDVRLVLLAAVTASALLIAYSRQSHVARLASLLFVLTPDTYFVVHAGWTEPLAVLALSLTMFSAFRAPRLLPFAFGCLLAVKQYTVFTIFLAPLFRPALKNGLRALIAKACAVAAALTLPIVLWNPGAYIHSAIALQFRQPFRMDALSYAVYLVRSGWGPPLNWLGFPALGLSLIVALRKLPASAPAFAAGAAVAYLAFFSVNKQAFCNYYYFVIGAMCCAVAATASRAER